MKLLPQYIVDQYNSFYYEYYLNRAQKKIKDRKFKKAKYYLSEAFYYNTKNDERAYLLLDALENIEFDNSESSINNSSPRERPATPSNEPILGRDYTQAQLDIVNKLRSITNFYDILGVSRDASTDEIKKNYKKLALQLHPDKNHAPGALMIFQTIAEAVATLTDPEKRRKYDAMNFDVKHFQFKFDPSPYFEEAKRDRAAMISEYEKHCRLSQEAAREIFRKFCEDIEKQKEEVSTILQDLDRNRPPEFSFIKELKTPSSIIAFTLAAIIFGISFTLNYLYDDVTISYTFGENKLS